jgi:hypothetical protein
MRPCLEKAHHKKRLVEWLKVKALSSNPSTQETEIRRIAVRSQPRENSS